MTQPSNYYRFFIRLKRSLIRTRLEVKSVSQQTRDINPMLFHCLPAIYDAGPTFMQYRVNLGPCVTGVLPANTTNLHNV